MMILLTRLECCLFSLRWCLGAVAYQWLPQGKAAVSVHTYIQSCVACTLCIVCTQLDMLCVYCTGTFIHLTSVIWHSHTLSDLVFKSCLLENQTRVVSLCKGFSLPLLLSLPPSIPLTPSSCRTCSVISARACGTSANIDAWLAQGAQPHLHSCRSITLLAAGDALLACLHQLVQQGWATFEAMTKAIVSRAGKLPTMQSYPPTLRASPLRQELTVGQQGTINDNCLLLLDYPMCA